VRVKGHALSKDQLRAQREESSPVEQSCFRSLLHVTLNYAPILRAYHRNVSMRPYPANRLTFIRNALGSNPSLNTDYCEVHYEFSIICYASLEAIYRVTVPPSSGE
jgi:hypothetical protein